MWDQATQGNIEKTISKSFQFMIYDHNTGIPSLNYAEHPVMTLIDSPLKQVQSGIAAKDVKCNAGFQLIFKAEDDSSACVKPDTAQKLIERGWAKNPIGVSALANPPIGLYNLTTSVKPIILGIPFYVNAVVVNHETEPITYYGGCVSPLSVSFDNIKESTGSIHCLAISKYTLGPNESVSVHSDEIQTLYNATAPNATNAAIKFSYQNDGKQGSMNTSMQLPIQAAIMIDCSTNVLTLFGRRASSSDPRSRGCRG